MDFPSHENSGSHEHRPVSPQECSSDMSTVTIGDDNNDNDTCPIAESPVNFPEVDEDFWSEVLSTESSGVVSDDFSAVGGGDPPLDQVPFSPLMTMEPVHGYGSNMHDSMDFWFNVFTRAGEIPELPDF